MVRLFRVTSAVMGQPWSMTLGCRQKVLDTLTIALGAFDAVSLLLREWVGSAEFVATPSAGGAAGRPIILACPPLDLRRPASVRRTFRSQFLLEASSLAQPWRSMLFAAWKWSRPSVLCRPRRPILIALCSRRRSASRVWGTSVLRRFVRRGVFRAFRHGRLGAWFHRMSSRSAGLSRTAGERMGQRFTLPHVGGIVVSWWPLPLVSGGLGDLPTLPMVVFCGMGSGALTCWRSSIHRSGALLLLAVVSNSMGAMLRFGRGDACFLRRRA